MKADVAPEVSQPEHTARLIPRLLSMAYEAVLLIAILFVASYLFLSVARDAQSGALRIAHQLYLFTVCGIYFVFCWVRGGQTLPMKTWRLKLVCRDDKSLEVWRAVARYLAAVPGTVTGLSLLWAFFDPQRQFLHDRLAGTRIVEVRGLRTED
ncbi:MAG: RDD family protein [Burkholderiales bacterium]